MDMYRSEFEKKDIVLEMLTIGHATVGKEWHGDEVNSPFSFLYYIEDGCAEIVAENEKICLVPGNWYLLPAGYRFVYSCPEKMTQYYFHIKMCGEDNLDLLADCKKLLFMKENVDFSIVKEYIKNGRLTEGLGVKGMVYSTVFELLNRNDVRIQQNKLSPCVRSAVEFINKNLSAGLSSEKIAESAFVSKSTLSKYFAREMQLSIQEYLFDLIFDKACGMLLADRKSIGQISAELGFCDQLYFSKKFRARYGLSPREYRKKYV